jgi:hypothetical protein
MKRSRIVASAASIAGLTSSCQLVLPVHEASAPVDEADAGAIDAGDAGPVETATLLFSSKFEQGVRLEAPSSCATGNCEQAIVGGSLPVSRWPMSFWDGTGTMQLLAGIDVPGVTSDTIGNYMTNEIVSVPGPDGNPTWVLHQTVAQLNPPFTLNAYNFVPAHGDERSTMPQGDLYIAHWMKLGQDVSTQLGPSGYRQTFQLFQEGQSRVSLLLATDKNRTPSWQLQGRYENASLDWDASWPEDIPSTWFKLEVFWHPSESDGRVWVAVDGTKRLDHRGPNVMGTSPVTAIQMFVDSATAAPSEQWVTDLEIWNAPPRKAAQH